MGKYSGEVNKVVSRDTNQIVRLRGIVKKLAPGLRMDKDASIVLSNWINGVGQRIGRTVHVWHSRRHRHGKKGRITLGDVMQGLQRTVSDDVYMKVCMHMTRMCKKDDLI